MLMHETRNISMYTPLEPFNLEEQESLGLKQFNKLKGLAWVEQLFNLILLGAPGVGKLAWRLD